MMRREALTVCLTLVLTSCAVGPTQVTRRAGSAAIPCRRGPAGTDLARRREVVRSF